MAKQYAYTDEYGNEYTSAYCRIKEVNLNKDGQASLMFQVFKNAQAKLDGRSPVKIMNIDIDGVEFGTYFSATALETIGLNAYKVAYIYGSDNSLFPADAIDV